MYSDSDSGYVNRNIDSSFPPFDIGAVPESMRDRDWLKDDAIAH